MQLSPRERLLQAADELFYCEGVNTVGIDRVIAHAGVAKASLYTNFGSKDELIRAYLERRHASRREQIEQAIAVCESPRDKILAVFDLLGDLRGCPSIKAGAEALKRGEFIEVDEADLEGYLEQLTVTPGRNAN